MKAATNSGRKFRPAWTGVRTNAKVHGAAIWQIASERKQRIANKSRHAANTSRSGEARAIRRSASFLSARTSSMKRGEVAQCPLVRLNSAEHDPPPEACCSGWRRTTPERRQFGPDEWPIRRKQRKVLWKLDVPG